MAVIPSLIIASIQISSHYLFFKDGKDQTTLSILAVLVWGSYYLAIYTPPGTPPKGYRIDRTVSPQKTWYKYCTKCKQDKPERTHHCKTCKQCVLRMDHHCPWTMNCVGHENMPHFIRFLVWVLVATSYTFWNLSSKLAQYYTNRHLPAYLFNTKDVFLVIATALLSFFVLFTIGILFIRTFFSLTTNETTIENWERERIQTQFYTEKFWIKIRNNYRIIHGKSLPTLTSWKSNYRELKPDSNIPPNFSYDDLIFPYDTNSAFQNLCSALGPVYLWLWPWGRPREDGIHFTNVNEDEDQLNLPWPPDGSNFESQSQEQTVSSWSNQLGETLDDFGVDVSTEPYESSKYI
ncbi:hypothetical protein OGAPHI_006792 [Ogataea philodendri]|uniref:Palmitoyltransferase n=1 Tax=Ogataea philodendri TaxID=1378263 RepID=A0A9P8T0Z7_9ASCO|nr:uncharacterized protein OGAPHI_006792 [Ogataea philodendri]KAH3661385.1 hypothetical protein OGAPHI_006792 [Ogataea philodendri]